MDVSLEQSSVCIVDGSGKIFGEGKVASEPEPLIGYLQSLGVGLSRVGLEAGPLSQWLYAAMRQAGLAVELLETRHVRDAFSAMPVKSDRNDARGIAQLMRLGWFRPVHCKSIAAQEVRAMLTARKLVQSKLHDVENSLRGILRDFGLKVGKTTAKSFAQRIRDLVAGQANLETIAQALLAVHTVLLRELNGFDRRVRQLARTHRQAKLLMTTPAVGPIVALTYAGAIDDPARFRSSKRTGAHFGLTPKKYQSGQTDYTGRISKIGDAAVREALYQAAHVMLTKPVKGCAALKSWAMRIARRAGMRKAKVALARKLAVIMHRMLADAKPFHPAAAAPAAAAQRAAVAA
ncbi:MAG: IS110 family transposase [Rhodanobacteraceae bacterium]